MITHSRHEGVEVWPGRQVYGHHVTDVAVECLEHGPALHVPQGGGGVPGASQHLPQSANQSRVFSYDWPIRSHYIIIAI